MTSGGRQVGGEGGRAALVVDEAQRPVALGQPQRGLHHVGPAGAAHPRGAHDGGAGRALPLAAELGPAVDRARVRLVPLDVGPVGRAVEDVVGRDVDEVGPAPPRHASATWRVPRALTAYARSGSASQASTAVQAAAWTTTSGRSPSTASSTAARSSTARARWSAADHLLSRAAARRPRARAGRSAARPAGTAPRAPSTRSRPSCPPAPVTRTLTGRSLTAAAAGGGPGRLDHRGPVHAAGSHHDAVVGVPAHRVGQALGEGDLRRPAELALDLGGVEQVAPVVARAVRDDLLQRGRLAQRAPAPGRRSPRCWPPPRCPRGRSRPACPARAPPRRPRQWSSTWSHSRRFWVEA